MSEQRKLARTPSNEASELSGRCRPVATASYLAFLAVLALSAQGCGDPERISAENAASTNAEGYNYNLLDHPDAREDPPPYGLRLDGVEWAVLSALGLDTTGVDPSATWTFSFVEGPAGVTGTFIESTSAFVISGIGYGGLDNDQASGPGEVEIRFVYLGVTAAALENGLFEQDGVGVGSITFLDNNNGDVLNGITVLLRSVADADGLLFQFANDGHRLLCPDDPACDFQVGRGWLEITGIEREQGEIEFQHRTEFQDWLFTSMPEL